VDRELQEDFPDKIILNY